MNRPARSVQVLALSALLLLLGTLAATTRTRADPVPLASIVSGELSACLTPAGTLYVIKLPGLPDSCRSSDHAEISWNIQGPRGDQIQPSDPTGSMTEVVRCPAGTTVTGGGWLQDELQPRISADGWFLQVREETPVASWVTANAMCVDVE